MPATPTVIEQAELVEMPEVSSMSEPASRPPPLFHRRSLPRRLARSTTVDLVGLAALLAVLGFLWGGALRVSFWLDEGIAAGVAAHPLRDIPHLLLQESAPPLYYLILHVWTSLLGQSNTAMHSLSLLFALAIVPAALWAGRSLFDRRTGWICALLVGINPFVAYYATETRMYSLALLLALLTAATFLHVFVFGRRRYLPWFALCLALLLYTHNWGLLLALGAAAGLVPLLVLTVDRRRLLIDAVLGFGAVVLLYAVWVPALAYQIRHPLQPWGSHADLVTVRRDVTTALGGQAAFVALGLGAGIGLAAMLQGKWWLRRAMAVAVLGIIPAVALAAGWRGSPWAYRYLAVIVGPLVLLIAIGLANSGRAGLAALGVAGVLSAPLAVRVPAYEKSNVQAVADDVSPKLRPGDLVVLPDLQMVPLAAHYLRPGLRYATTSGPVTDPNVVDWLHSLDRLRNDDPDSTLPPLIRALPRGAHLLMMCPAADQVIGTMGLAQAQDAQRQGASAGTAIDRSVQPKITPLPKDNPFQSLILTRCQQTKDLLDKEPDLQLQELTKAPGGVRSTSVDAMLLTKGRSAAPGAG